MQPILESEGSFALSEYPRLVGYTCHGCNQPFDLTDRVEVILDRVGHRSYVIHYGCWSLLADKLRESE